MCIVKDFVDLKQIYLAVKSVMTANYSLQLVNALTTIRSINRTDATVLLTTFGSLEKILKATPETLGLCPGLGPQKANRLHKVLHQTFLRESAVKGKVKSLAKC
jgi:DNA excision repair protein ERCC-1